MVTGEWVRIGEEQLAQTLQEAEKSLAVDGDELALDFSAVQRIDAAGLRGLEELVSRAEEKRVKLVLRGIGVRVYRVLKLMRLTSRFSFVN